MWRHVYVTPLSPLLPLPETDSGADPHHQGAVQVEGRHSRLLRLRQREQSQRRLPGHLLLRHPVDAHWLTHSAASRPKYRCSCYSIFF